MKIGKFVKNINNKIYTTLISQAKKHGEIKNIKRKEKIYKYTKLTTEQEKEIQEFYQKYYGKKIDTRWHRLYQSYMNSYDKKYFPEILFSTKLETKLSNPQISSILGDKAMVELLYKSIDGLYIPETIVICCSGIYYDSQRNVINKEKAIELLANCGKKVIKKTKKTSSGRDVLIIDVKNSYDRKNNVKINELIEKFGDNFIVQELIKNSDEISKLYPKSLNTFRVITYVVNGKLYHVPIALRIGQGGKEVDNIHSGGIFIGVSDDGKLQSRAFTEYHDVYIEHPNSKIKFEGYKINGIDRMIDIAYKCHGRTPHLGIISWDFTIDNQDRVVLIEVNLNGQSIWFPQMANGKSAFGNNTEYMLQLIKKS